VDEIISNSELMNESFCKVGIELLGQLKMVLKLHKSTQFEAVRCCKEFTPPWMDDARVTLAV